MRPCKLCNKGIPAGQWIGEIDGQGRHTFWHLSCFQLRNQDSGEIVAPETNAEYVAKKIARLQAEGRLHEYPLEQRLKDLQGDR